MKIFHLPLWLAAIVGISTCSGGDSSGSKSSPKPVQVSDRYSEILLEDSSGSKPLPEPEGELIPSSVPEKAKYYLISAEQDGPYIRTLNSQVWPPYSTMARKFGVTAGYTVTQIDCKGQRYMELGYGDNDPSHIKMHNNTEWINTIVTGSIRYDLAKFVCNRSD